MLLENKKSSNCTQAATFDLRNFTARLNLLKEESTQLVCECPVCGGHRLTISKKSGAYQCWSGGCATADIRSVVAPRTERHAPQHRYPITRKSARKLLPPVPQSTDHKLAKLPTPAIDSPQPQKDFERELGEVLKTTYVYSLTPDGQLQRWVVRTDWSDPNKPLGRDKTFRQWHRDASGLAICKKGDEAWEPYRIDEFIAALKAATGFAAGLVQEGEAGVEKARAAGIASITWQGSAWSQNDLERALQKVKQSCPKAILAFLRDNDTAGEKKAQAFQAACTRVGIFSVVIDPVAISPELPDKGDIVEILAAMDVPEFIRRLESEIHASVESRRNSELADDSFALDIPDSLDPDTEFTQRALNFLYGDKPWICASDKLYFWTGSYYKHSPDAVERPKIASFCNSYAVQQKDGSIRYPYAKPAKVREVLQWVKDRLEIDPNLLNPPGLNCTNGVLELLWNGSTPSWRLVDHAPALYYTYEPIATYDPNADPQDCDRLLAALEPGQREIFLRTIAASLDLPTVRKYKGRLVRGLLLKGDGSNGKDSLREVVAAMYGYKGITGCTLTDFKAYDDGRKFPLSRLRLSRINWATENANTAKVDKIQSIKAFITGDTLSSEGKGKDEEDFTPAGVGLFNVNDTPNLQASLEAIASRWGVLSFTKTFKIGADPLKGEIEADPRFKYDPEFLQQQVLPAFLNRVLAALVDLMHDGIDFTCTHKALLDIQAENSHLFQFCQQTGLGYDPNGTLGIGELWERLKAWYIDNGTLTIEVSDKGKEKNIWIDQVRKGDANVKGANQVLARFIELFPKAKRCHLGNNLMGIQGLAFGISHLSPQISQPLANELACNPDTARNISQLSQLGNSDGKNETETCNAQQSERIELNDLVCGEQVTQLANQPDTVSDTASVVTNSLANQSPKKANATPVEAEAGANNVPSPSAVAAQILQCQTWVAAVEAMDCVAAAVNQKRATVLTIALKHISIEQRQHLVRLLAAHMQQFPQDSDAYSWLPQSSRKLKQKAQSLIKSH
ncbi:MAG: hypothetical protein N4J56_007870 [Chroococcidiopsis sp. SAG 2025]|uniref:DUF5906 domain-containing protein n=1 Tax=Chroococcidiopsis sp. SAG 2025 TaxID=171389 RepID=UPI00293736B6|nr:DUF5906 domain-containing protein [Chroococcidiopsis sp. SAG 2025]MDV2998165.1 hypothetical protein [Chroococcidiopsis sp. SAG 2025]